MRKLVLLYILLLFVPLCGSAQGRYHFMRTVRATTQPEDRLRMLSDSLTALHNRIFAHDSTGKSTSHRLPSDSCGTEAARLLLPMTFYDDIAGRAFTPGKTLSFADEQLLTIYMNNPWLVTGAEKDIREAGTPVYNAETPLRPKTDLIEKAGPEFVEPEAGPFTLVLKKPNFWTYKGDFALQFMQNYISGNWYKGGESNYSALSNMTLEANFNNKQKIKWDNKLEIRFGMQNTRSDTLHTFKTTEDMYRLTSKFGLQAHNSWYYTVQLIAYSQFTHSYKSNSPTLYSDFLAPLNLNLSLGMDYNADLFRHRLKGTVHLAPFAYNMKYTRKLSLCDRLGMDPDHHFKNDFGSEFTVNLTWQIMDMLQWKMRLYGYTSYERAELEWENTFTLRFNKWISAQVFIYPRFDDGVKRDDHHGYWQFKEYLSVGFQYTF